MLSSNKQGLTVLLLLTTKSYYKQGLTKRIARKVAREVVNSLRVGPMNVLIVQGARHNNNKNCNNLWSSTTLLSSSLLGAPVPSEIRFQHNLVKLN